MSEERCAWVSEEPIYIAYHDEEWGTPVFGDDRYLFEMLTLEGAQAGLSWITILKRRENYRRAFDNFEVDVIAAYSDEKVEALMQDEGIIRNRRKIESVIKMRRRSNRFRKSMARSINIYGDSSIESLL